MENETELAGSEGAPEEPGFASFGLDPRIVSAIEGMGFESPTPIQREAIPKTLTGRDVLGRARTGSGKTAAFGLPLLERVKTGGRQVRALVLAPTRELALQVTGALQDFAQNLPVRIVTVYGGASYGPQLSALRDGVAVVVGTPGRVLDYLERGSLDLSQLEMLVLDEADEMLRMGFIDDVERVLEAAPDSCQVALFSATMPDAIRRVANAHLSDPIEVQVESSALSVGHIEQRYVVVPQGHKAEALARVLAAKTEGTTIVFARTRAGAAEAADVLANRGLPVDALHGDLNQGARERVIARLRSGRLGIVVATDVAARGLDIDHVTHVINLDLPPRPEEYVHRIGRTGRAGREGHAISFVTPSEESRLRAFQRLLKVTIAPMDVPTDATIARARKARLRAQVLEVAANETAPELSAFVEDLKTELEPDAIATTLLGLLADARGLDLHEGSDQPPHWARRFAERRAREQEPRGGRRERRDDFDAPRSRPRGPAVEGDELEIVVGVGRARGVRAQDLVGAIANEADVPGSAIGKISIVDRASFVKVPRSVAEHLLKHHRSLIVRGRPARIDLARGVPPARDRRDEKRARDEERGFDEAEGGEDGGFEERGPRVFGGPGRDDRGFGGRDEGGEDRPRRGFGGPRRDDRGFGGGEGPRRGFGGPRRDDRGFGGPRRDDAGEERGVEASWGDFEGPSDAPSGEERPKRAFGKPAFGKKPFGKKPFGKKGFGSKKPGGFAPPKRKR
ncbi:MAG: DEAD/DEAH box helicase [Sandaracinus sp.]|nr:DEAD/DEAH box helicase [Sandaracinus sp.]